MFCRIYQWAIEKDLDDFGSVRRQHVAVHLQKCSRCRAYYHEMMRLGQQLRSAPSGEFSDEQLEKIHQAIGQQLSEKAPVQSTFSAMRSSAGIRMRYAVAAAAAIVLVSLIGLYSFHHPGPPQLIDPLSQFADNSAAFQNRMSLLARLPEQPIQTEMYKLANDAKSGIKFLTDFIPDNVIAMNTGTTGNGTMY